MAWAVALRVAVFAWLWVTPQALAADRELLQRSAKQAYFSGFDRDGDGRVGVQEYLDYMRAGFDALDRNGNGIIDDDELPSGARRSHSRQRSGHEQAVRQTFHRLDVDGNGWLSVDELTAPPR